MKHLFLAVTAHGYGHLAQSAPIAEALARRIPDLRVTLQADINPLFVRRRLPSCTNRIPENADVGLLMDGPLKTRWTESIAEYERFEREYDHRLTRQLKIFKQNPPDLLLADVPWLPLDAARILSIPAVALCSLSWYDILAESPVADRLPVPIIERMRAVYGSADLFIRPAPSMSMAWLPNGRDVGPIAMQRPNRAAQLRAQANIPTERPLVLLQFGGFEGFAPLREWPEQKQVHWLLPTLGGNRRSDTLPFEDLGLGVLDILGSCDAILSKPGYGTVAEAACNGKPMLYVSRQDWPEEAPLISWLRRQVPTREVSLRDLTAGRVIEPLLELVAAGPVTAMQPSGIEETAAMLEPLLRAG